MHVVLTKGSFSLTASQIQDQEGLYCKNAAAISSAISLAEYAFNRPEISIKTRAAFHLKLDFEASSNFSWRAVHDNMLMHCSIALNNLTKTIFPIDEDQR